MIPPRMSSKKPRRFAAVAGAVAIATLFAACGSQTVEQTASNSPEINRGAQLFYQRCSGCHTLSAAAAEGSSTKVRDRERTDGPNFDQRKETAPNVLYAIRNGGFSGAIMPQNIVVGEDAQAVAEFLAKHSGRNVSAEASSGSEQTSP
jgi:mono/diheme cytochrome c family protein